ncbi:MAG TPA: hypothetical protein GXX36_01090 [Clostridiaceae bacterium]|nr:hypothetical protein [Clostridiaceae bacterium]
MFGYVLPEKSELKIREYETFRAFYCGICKSMGRRYGQLSRLTLNYDSVFLAILLSSIADEIPEIKRERCIAHPMKKKFKVTKSDIVDYASDINLILAYYKLKDNWRDERNLLSGGAILLLKSAHEKLKKKYSKKCAIIEDKLKELTELETSKCNSMDRAAEPFARIMEEVFCFEPLCDSKEIEKQLRVIGYNIGKWIYILDAYDDIEADIRNNSYNVFIYQFGVNKDNLQDYKPSMRDRIDFNLTYALGEISKACKQLGLKINSGIIENIVYLGMLRKMEHILKAGSCKKVEESI